jgi:AraC family ethanolamine operon transcriptional activator
MDMSTDDIQMAKMVMENFDPGAMTHAVNGGDLEHTQVAPGHFRGELMRARMGEIVVDQGCYNLPVLAEGVLAADGLTLGLVSSGEETIFNGRRLSVRSKLLFSEGHELVAHLPSQSRWLAVRIERDRLARLGLDFPAQVFATTGINGAASTGLFGAVFSALEELKAEYSSKELASVKRRVQSFADLEDLAINILANEMADEKPGARRERALNAYRLARKGRDYLAANIDTATRISDMCSEVGTTYRAVERAFMTTYGVSPKRYLLLRRLAKLRETLQDARDEDRSLSDAYLSCGLVHFGRAAAEYRAIYGELPSVTQQGAA